MAKQGKLLSMRKVRPKSVEMDSIKRAKEFGNRRAFDILLEAQRCWDNMSRFRRERMRNRNYTFGKQWKDFIKVDDKYMTEEQYIIKEGNVPLQNNLIRRLVNTVVGVFRAQAKEPTCVARDREEQRLGETMSTVLQYNMQLNKMDMMYARTMQDFLIGALVVHRKSYGWRNDKLDCWTDNVNPNNFFVDNCMRDYRGWDVSMIGEVHDVSFEDLCGEFADSAREYTRLYDIYRYAQDKEYLMDYGNEFGYDREINYDFLWTSDPNRCRVVEVWRKESKPRYRCHDWNSGEIYKIETKDYKDMVVKENEARIRQGKLVGMAEDDIPLIEATWFIDTFWYFYYLTPFGDILREGETPYEHKSHPYVFLAYPFIDGEIHSFVADIIDQQRYVNRLITLYDWIMRASAKGVLMFPEGALPDGMSMEDIADEWSRFNGIIFFKAKTANSPMPKQIANNCTNIGITELLNLQLKFFEEISGVQGALQGKSGFAGMSAALYNQQTQNATTSLLDILETFSTFIIDAAVKDVKNIQQFYDASKIFNIAGRNAVIEEDAEKIRDVEFDLSIVESTTTPAYRQLANDMLMQLWQAGAIGVEQLLEHGNFPFADELLQSLRSQQEQIQQGGQPQLPQQLQQRVQQGADMNAVNQAYQALRGGQQPQA